MAQNPESRSPAIGAPLPSAMQSPLPRRASPAHSSWSPSEGHTASISSRLPIHAKWTGAPARPSGYNHWCWDCGAPIGQHTSRLDSMRKPYTYSEREVTPSVPPEAEYDAETGNCWGAATPCEIQFLPVCLWCELERLDDNNVRIAHSILGAFRELSAASRALDQLER